MADRVWTGEACDPNTSGMDKELRRQARAIFDAGVAAADPALAVVRSLEQRPLVDCVGRVFIIAVGKAATGMAKAAMVRVNAEQVIVVTNYENACPLARATTFASGHPIPDENGLTAARAVEDLLHEAGEEDHVLALISGGGSALLPSPAQGLSLADKAEVSRLLLGAGMEISAMNLVRQQLSRLKGGGFLRVAAPARVTALILSDVVGDDLAVVASGPTVAPIGSKAKARTVLEKARIWDQIPAPVRNVLIGPERPTVNIENVENRLIGSNAQSVAAMAALAPEAQIFPHALEGDVADAADIITRCKGRGIWLFGGETTVRLKGDGLGGRNQELALRVALKAEELGWDGNWVFLSGGTDGRDGPTDAAGGLVDAGTLKRMRAAGVNPLKSLENNDSYHALQAAGDLLKTSATGTNVADLQVLIRA